MGLKADVEEGSKAWRVAPWRVRVFYGLSVFLASRSVAALSETVARWKGFLLDRVTFYQKYVSSPLDHSIRDVLLLPLPVGVSDAVVLLTLLAGANTRVMLCRGAGQRTRLAAIAFLLAAILLIGGLELWKGSSLSGRDMVLALSGLTGYASARYWFIGRPRACPSSHLFWHRSCWSVSPRQLTVDCQSSDAYSGVV